MCPLNLPKYTFISKSCTFKGKLDPFLQICVTFELDDVASSFKLHFKAKGMSYLNEIKAQK